MFPFKYQPKKFEDVILNDDIKPKLEKVLHDVPNLLLYGKSGTGKGTFTNVLIDHTGYHYLWCNASEHTGIDFIREKVKPFATAMAMTDKKIVVLNEADSLTSGPQGSQKMLRQLMEDVEKTCRFILLCNYEGNIIPEIKSRCQVIEMNSPPKKQIGLLCLKILKKEKIEGDSKHVIDIVKKCYPDIRKTLMVLEENIIKGKLEGSNISASESIWQEILDSILRSDIEKTREIIKSNYIEYPSLYEHLYNNAGKFKEPGAAIMKVAEHLYRHSTVDIPEINFIHMVVDMIYEKIV